MFYVVLMWQVLLLSHSDRISLHQKTFGVGKDGHVDETYEPTDFFKNIGFLVGKSLCNLLM